MSKMKEVNWSGGILRLYALFFVGILILGGIAFWVAPKHQISENENRKLAELPSLTYSNIITGKFAAGIEFYYADNFIGRNTFISLANIINNYRGIHNSDIRIYKNYPKEDTLLIEPTLPPDTMQIDTALQPDPTIEPFNMIENLVVYNKRALQIFTPVKSALANYANLINQYRQELADTITLYCMVIPTGADFYLPENFSPKKNVEKNAIDYFYTLLNDDIKKIDVCSALLPHKQEYLHFNTDHHWTNLGAYYAYKDFCKVANLVPLPIDSCKRVVIHNFLGTLYYKTLSEELAQNPDSVIYYKIPNKTTAQSFSNTGSQPKPANLYAEYHKGRNAYGVFLGHDYPLMSVKSDIKNGKRILVVKDSFGNAFIPFLASHYEEVWIVDYRYYTGNIPKLLKEHQISNLLFAHNIFIINSKYTRTKELNLLHQVKPKPAVTPKDSTLLHTDTIKILLPTSKIQPNSSVNQSE